MQFTNNDLSLCRLAINAKMVERIHQYRIVRLNPQYKAPQFAGLAQVFRERVKEIGQTRKALKIALQTYSANYNLTPVTKLNESTKRNSRSKMQSQF